VTSWDVTGSQATVMTNADGTLSFVEMRFEDKWRWLPVSKGDCP
jgi:hypothetical protein